MRRLICVLTAMGICLAWSPTMAQDDLEPAEPAAPKVEKKEKAKTPKPKVELIELSLTGTVTKKETTRKNKKGEEKTTVSYVLTDEAGKVVALPKPQAKKGKEGEAAKAVDLASYVDKKVTITGKGTEQVKKNEKGEETKKVLLRKIEAITEAE